MVLDDSERGGVDNWVTQLRKGVLEFCLLNLLAGSELYGYDVVKRLASVKGLIISEGTVYPLLARMKKQGMVRSRLVESGSGPVRKYYSLTPEGYRVREQMNAFWNDMAGSITALQEDSEDGRSRENADG